MFFRAQDPETLAAWYEEHLGIARPPQAYDQPVWWQEDGVTIWAPFSNDTEEFGRPEQAWMINFRVRSLDAMVAQLRQAGVAVEVDPETYPNGHFARLADPEGNPIQLWEPAGASTQRPPG
jgi:predicted enzyme related to lactoylglutathione lyase